MTEESKAEKFLEIFAKGKEFTEEILRDNQRLRYRVAALENDQSPAPGAEIEKLRQQIVQLTEETRALRLKYREVEQENKDFASRYVEIEQQNSNLANLYVASYQLHSTLEFREVIQVLQEIIINLIGAEAFALLLLDEGTNELKSIAWEGSDILPGIDTISAPLTDGLLGDVARSGVSHYGNDPKATPSLQEPLAVLPLKIKDTVIGVIIIYKLLEHKESFNALDYELFSLLAFHAATAIFSSRLYSLSARKLNTIQNFLELLTT
jgi:nitrate/nitrite-specific signal transduction histidine kinase